MRRGILLAVFFLIFVNILFVSATFAIGNASHSISGVYGPGEGIQGWVNVSLVNEYITTLFDDKLGHTSEVLDFLRSDTTLAEDVDYFCNPVGCGSTYSASNGETSKTFELKSGEIKIVGFKFDGTVNNIEDPVFEIISNAEKDCINQLKINFFADEVLDYGNDKVGSGFCSAKRDYGCFNETKTSDFDLNMAGNGKMFCQRITLHESPGFELGARLKILDGADTTKMAIYNLEFMEKLAECELNDTPVDDAEVSCEVELLVAERAEYYVCISNDNGVDTNTKLRNYADVNGCGFYTTGMFAVVESAAYQIFAEGKKFDEVGTLDITGDYPIDELGSEMSDYIYETYGSNTCPAEGCIIPIELISAKDQNITIEDITVPYDSSQGPKTISNIFDIDLSSAKVSTDGFKKIMIDSSVFVVPGAVGGITYSLFYDINLIFDSDISITPVPEIESLFPLIAFTQFPTNFYVNVKKLDNASIESYSWQFGSANPETTTENKISHTFTKIENVPLKVSVTDVNGKTGSRTFTIDVGDYQALFLKKLTEAKANALNISSSVSKLSQFYQDGIKIVLNANAITQELTRIELAYEAASEASAYSQVVNDFLALRIPSSIDAGVSTEYVSFYSNREAVNAQVVREFLGGSLDGDEFEYSSAISDWSVRNIDAKIKYKRFDAKYADGIYPIVGIFELNVKQIGNFDSSASIFIKQLEDMQFDKPYGETVKAGYIEIPLGSEKTISFLTTEDFDVTTVPIFISPSLDNLELITIAEDDEEGMRWALFIVIIIFLLLVGIVSYVFLQHWYKTKYETFLFKDRNFLFNLIHYIDAQKKKGVNETEIFRNLKKQGWNSEQVNYVVRKYLGKRTGMLELPVEKLLNLFKKSSVEKGMGAPVKGVPPMGRPMVRPPMRRPPIRKPIGKRPMPPKKGPIKK